MILYEHAYHNSSALLVSLLSFCKVIHYASYYFDTASVPYLNVSIVVNGMKTYAFVLGCSNYVAVFIASIAPVIMIVNFVYLLILFSHSC